MIAQRNSLSFLLIVAMFLFCEALIFGFAFFFCYAYCAYILRNFCDMIFAFGFTFFGIGVMAWAGRVARFYLQTNSFKESSLAPIDNLTFTRRFRIWLYVLRENEFIIAIVVSGLLAVILAILFGQVLSSLIPPDTALEFLKRRECYWEPLTQLMY